EAGDRVREVDLAVRAAGGVERVAVEDRVARGALARAGRRAEPLRDDLAARVIGDGLGQVLLVVDAALDLVRADEDRAVGLELIARGAVVVRGSEDGAEAVRADRVRRAAGARRVDELRAVRLAGELEAVLVARV